jgi:hypothetical protein
MMHPQEKITLNTSTRSLYQKAVIFILLGLCLNLLFHLLAGRLDCLSGCPTEWMLARTMQLMGTCSLYFGLTLLITNTARLIRRRLKQDSETNLSINRSEAITATVSIKALYVWSIGMLALNMFASFVTRYLYANLWCKGDHCAGHEILFFLCQFVVSASYVATLTLFIGATFLAIRRKLQQHIDKK